jgi:carbon-monoxide dehydrogenase catalytic subunit
VAGIVGCNNPRVCEQDAYHQYLVDEFIRNDVLVVQTGCGALSSAKIGLLTPETALEKAGPGLREVCEALGIPPVLHLGSCVDNTRILTVLTQMASEGGLGTDISDIPAVGIAPEWMSEKALSIGCYFVASGVYTIFGGTSPVQASPVVSDFISKGWEERVGGKLEFVEEVEEILERSFRHIDAKRKALGLAEYDPRRYGASGDALMMKYLAAVEAGRPVSPYSTRGLE